MKCKLIHIWILLMVSSGFISAQEKDSTYLEPPAATVDVTDTIPLIQMQDTLNVLSDTIPHIPVETVLPADTLSTVLPADTLSLSQIDGFPPLDSIPSLPDSLRRTVVVGRVDPLDSLSNRLFAYQVLSINSYARTQMVIDTALRFFQINNPMMRNYFAGAHLGNTGSSFCPIGFEARKRPSDFHFIDNVADYLHDPEAIIYYQTQFPYTHINYSSAGPKSQNESIFKLIHTQNINKEWNVGMHYDIFSSVGQYINQNASNNGYTLFSAYRGSQYSMYANFNWNNVRMRENGGLADVDNYMNNDEDPDPASSLMRSTNGKTVLLNRSLYMMHSYSPRELTPGRKNMVEPDSVDVSRFSFVHTLKYEWNKREFFDTETYAFQSDEPFFGNKSTHDSLYFRRISNRIELMIREQSRRRFTAGFSAGLLTEMDRYNTNIIPDIKENEIEPHTPPISGWGDILPEITGTEYTIYYRETKKYFNTAVTGRFFNHTGRYLNWDFNGKLYFTGYRTGDVNINGTVQMHYYTPNGRNSLLLGGSIENAQQGYFLNKYASNSLAWDNNFNPSQEIRLRGEFLMPHRKLKSGAYLSQLNNYVYINRDAVPEQTSEPLLTGTAYVEKDIRWWKLGFNFRLYGQYSSNEKIIPLPAFAGFQSTYFETWLVKNVLIAQLGWNVTYHTRYYAYAYMPVTGMFYLQEEQKIGNYPFFDFFLNFQINRARVFVKTDGLNTVFRKYLGKENFMAYRYPTNDFRMKFGVSWAFYD